MGVVTWARHGLNGCLHAPSFLSLHSLIYFVFPDSAVVVRVSMVPGHPKDGGGGTFALPTRRKGIER